MIKKGDLYDGDYIVVDDPYDEFGNVSDYRAGWANEMSRLIGNEYQVIDVNADGNSRIVEIEEFDPEYGGTRTWYIDLKYAHLPEYEPINMEAFDLSNLF